MDDKDVIERLGAIVDPICVPQPLRYASNFAALLDFAAAARVTQGFGYLNEAGAVDLEQPAQLWITCRMTHVFALAHMLGFAGARELAEHGVASLRGAFHDAENGGWFSAIDGDSGDVIDDAKAAYAHAFVLLAANSALAAEINGAEQLLGEALQNQDEHWFNPNHGLVHESWDREFNELEQYGGLNANMHTVEAYLAVADLTGNRELLHRSVDILRFVARQGGQHQWRLPEHYTLDWEVLPDYNRNQPAHPFRPYGATPGHGFEWARLMLQARQSVMDAGEVPDEWMLPAAVELYMRAAADSWAVDGQPGFIYTTDFAGAPVVTQRMHWVFAEAVGANVVLQRALMGGSYPGSAELRNTLREQLRVWGEYAGEYLQDAPGQWHHELDGSNRPDSGTWQGKPDAYHLAQMFLLPLLPVAPAFATALKRM